MHATSPPISATLATSLVCSAASRHGSGCHPPLAATSRQSDARIRGASSWACDSVAGTISTLIATELHLPARGEDGERQRVHLPEDGPAAGVPAALDADRLAARLERDGAVPVRDGALAPLLELLVEGLPDVPAARALVLEGHRLHDLDPVAA